MSGVDVSLLIGLVIAGGLSILARNFRGLAWLGAAAASYVVSVLYWRAGLPNGAAMAAACDIVVFLAINRWSRFRWELTIMVLFLLSIFVNTLYVAALLGAIPDFSHEAYSIALELINWLVLLSIGGMSALQLIEAYDAHHLHRSLRGLHWVVASLSRERARYPSAAGR